MHEALLNAFPDLIFIINREGRYIRTFGGADVEHYHDRSYLVGKTLFEVLPQETAELFLAEVFRALDENRVVRYRYTLSGNDVEGSKARPDLAGKLHFQAHISPIVIRPGEPPDMVMWVANNVTEFVDMLSSREREARRLINQAMRDQLTGVLNRRGFLKETERLRAARGKLASAVILADLDHFKILNDTHGHLAGDQALKVAARRLRAILRSTDLIGRFGGEEFIFWLDHVDPQKAEQLAERLRAAIANLPVSFENKPIALTASFGVTMLDPDERLETAIERADTALYEAKAAGRNRVQKG